jgi:SAM-dependent methyltransferase
MDQVKLQQEFHRQADCRRFRNRLKNPYIRCKEKQLTRRILQALPGSCRHLLEVGCGEGNNLINLHDLQPEMVCFGLDFSLAKAGFLKANFPGVWSVCGDAKALPFQAGRFDLVVLRDLLHHLPWCRDEVLQESLRVTRHGGVIVVLEGSGSAPLNRIFRWFYPAEQGMADNSAENLLRLGQRHAPARLEFVEATFLLRAVAFFLGWPEGLGRFCIMPLYLLLSLWEQVLELVLPQRHWSYMMLTLIKD